MCERERGMKRIEEEKKISLKQKAVTADTQIMRSTSPPADSERL